MAAVLAVLLALPVAAQSQDHLNRDTPDLCNAYIPSELIDKYGYLELATPRAYADDGLGTVKTKPLIQSHSQTVDDGLREWVNAAVPLLERRPADRAVLGEIVQVLGGQRLCTRIVPYMDRYLAAGGKPGYDAIMTYVGGLVRLGRPTDALQHYTQAEKRWGMMASSIAAQLYGDRFRTAWLIDRNFQDMLDAQRDAMMRGVFQGDRNVMQETILDFLRKAAERKELPWFNARMERSWIWMNEPRLKAVTEIYRSAGQEPPTALTVAADPLFQGAAVPAPALRYRAVDALNRGETELALRQAERSLELAKPKGLLAEFEALMTVVRVLRQRGELERAWERTEEAQKLAARSKGPPERGWAVLMKGSMYEKLGDNRRALESYAEGLGIGDLIGYSELIQSAKASTARALAHSGDASSVEPMFKHDAELALELRLFANVPNDYMNWGECLVTMKRYEAAVKAFRQATAPVKEVGAGYAIDLTCHMNCLKGLGYSLTELQKFDEAEKAYDEYADLASHSVGSTYNWVWQLGRAKCARGRKDPDAAKTWIDRCLDSIDAERASLNDFANRRSLNENKYEAFDLAIVMALERNDPDAAFRIAERSRARSFLDEMGAHSNGAKVHPPEDIASLALACPDECVVVYYQLPDRLLAWVVAGGKPHLVTMPWTPVSIQKSVEMLSAAIYLQSSILKDKKTALPGKSDAVVAAKDLYQRIWSPLVEHLPPQQRVCIVPHRALHYVPFQALHDGRNYLIESREIFYAPSASALVELKRRPAAPAADISVFDPILTDDPSSPFSKTESEALKKQYPSAGFVLRRNATLASFKERAPGSGLIHVSSHGYFDEWMPLESGLVFAGPKGHLDELLTAKDIYRMKLDKTELLVMSACVSSVGDFGNGDEVTGITRAFQVAGVRNVIGSLWPVENDATIQLMTLFHLALAETKSPAAALRRAQCEMIAKKATIVKWAPFGLTGLGGELQGSFK